MAVRLTFPATHVFLRTLCVAGLIVPALIRPSGAGEWTITPRVNVEQSVTDNVRSVSDGAESDFITTANAGVSVAGIGRSLQLNFNYNISQDKFWDSRDLDGWRQSLLGTSKMALYEDLVFLDTRASISQQSLQRNGGESAADRSIGTNDQTTIVNYSITPNYGYRYGSWATSDVSMSFNQTRFLEADTGTAGALPDPSSSLSIRSLLRSGPNFNKYSWQLSGSSNFTDNGSNRDVLEFSNEYAWSRHLTLLGRAGRETIENSGINADDSAILFWRGGARLTPGPRSTIRVEYGERFDDTTFSGDASYRFSPLTAISASYEVSVQTDRERLTENLNNLIVNEDGELVNPATGLPGSPNSSEFDFQEQSSKQQTFTIALNGTRGRNTFGLNSSVTTRTQLPANTEDTVLTFGGNINRRIWPDLTGGISTSYSATTESASGVEDFSVNGSLFLSYSIMKNLNGNLQYNFLYRDSDIDTNDLQENVISVSLSKSF